MVTRMIAVGEETGDIEGMLHKVADYHDSEVDATVKALNSITEPVMIVVVGAIVGVIIISMYLPMFRIYELIGWALSLASLDEDFFCRISRPSPDSRRLRGWRFSGNSATR